MDKSFEKRYHLIEKTHWWSLGRQDMILKLLISGSVGKKLKILDIGCAGGSLLKFLAKKGYQNTIGIDNSKAAVVLCRKEGLKNIFLRDAIKTGFKDEEFDIIIASDVLEHIKNDAAALVEWKRILKKGGKLLVFAPAFRFLWSVHDEANRHYRRYSLTELQCILKETGFKTEKLSYWNFCLFFPAAIIRILGRFSKKGATKEDRFYELNYFASKLLMQLLKIENTALTRLNFPFGISVFAVAKK